MTKNQLISLFFFGFLAFVLYQVCVIFSPFFEPIFWAAVIAFCAYPLYSKIRSLTGRETLAAFLTTLGVFLVVAPFVVYIVMRVSVEAVHLYDYVLKLIESGQLQRFFENLRRMPIIQRLKSHEEVWDFIRDHSGSWMLSSTRFLGTFVTGHVASITKNALLLLVNFILSLFLCFFFLRNGERMMRMIYETAPFEEKDKSDIFEHIRTTFKAVLQGQLLTAFVQAGLTALIFTILFLPLPILFAGLTFLFSMVPILGAASVWLPFVIYLAITHHWVQAIILLVFGIFGISLVDNFLKPAFIGERTKLPYMVLFIGILGGLKAFGLVGIFLAPTLLSVFLVLIRIYRQRYSS